MLPRQTKSIFTLDLAYNLLIWMDFLKLGQWPAMSPALAPVKTGSFTGKVLCDFTLKALLEECVPTPADHPSPLGREPALERYARMPP